METVGAPPKRRRALRWRVCRGLGTAPCVVCALALSVCVWALVSVSVLVALLRPPSELAMCAYRKRWRCVGVSVVACGSSLRRVPRGFVVCVYMSVPLFVCVSVCLSVWALASVSVLVALLHPPLVLAECAFHKH